MQSPWPRFLAVITVLVLSISPTGGSEGPSDGPADWPMFKGAADRNGPPAEASLPRLDNVDWSLRVRDGFGDLSSPVLHDGAVYVGGEAVLALNATDGRQLWRHRAAGDLVTATPSIANGIVYVGSRGGEFVALDARTGAPVWLVTMESPVRAAAPVADGVVYVVTEAGTVRALDALTGEARWERALGVGALGGGPAVSRGLLVVGGDDRRLHALWTANGTLAWSTQVGQRGGSSPAISGDAVLVGSGDGRIYSLDLATGVPRWTYEADHGVTDVAVADGLVFAGTLGSGLLTVGERDGALRWRSKPSSFIAHVPTAHEGRVYAGDYSGRLYAFDAESGARVWEARLGRAIVSSASIDRGVAYVVVHDRAEFIREGESATVDRVHALSVADSPQFWLLPRLLPLFAAAFAVFALVWLLRRPPRPRR